MCYKAGEIQYYSILDIRVKFTDLSNGLCQYGTYNQPQGKP